MTLLPTAFLDARQPCTYPIRAVSAATTLKNTIIICAGGANDQSSGVRRPEAGIPGPGSTNGTEIDHHHTYGRG